MLVYLLGYLGIMAAAAVSALLATLIAPGLGIRGPDQYLLMFPILGLFYVLFTLWLNIQSFIRKRKSKEHHYERGALKELFDFGIIDWSKSILAGLILMILVFLPFIVTAFVKLEASTIIIVSVCYYALLYYNEKPIMKFLDKLGRSRYE